MTAPAQAATGRTDPGVEAQYAIEIEGLDLSYGQGRVVRDLSMHVPHGSVYGLVGPSGAGKSTVMRAIATLEPLDAGSILVDGIDLSADPAAVRDRIGYLPDVSGVYGDLTVVEYLDFYGAIYRIPPRRRRQSSEELLELVGLTAKRDDPVGSLPRGLKQKLGLARCLIHDPDILLLDEPAAGLDPDSRLELRDMVRELAHLGKAILISSHLLSDLADICTHLGIMREGELLMEAALDEMMAALFPESYLRVHLLDPADADTVSHLLAEHPGCRQVEATEPAALLARFDGGEGDLASLLGQLLRSGVRVTEYTLEQPTLEDLFARVTAEEDK